ncbi:hypothetical protein ACFZCG_23680 [Streptomyces tanashiensis]|uniref:hypothetical protein n=1 Tax=Streptomyces tanashiensis TaxID=67367 RepID=UPI0036EA036B
MAGKNGLIAGGQNHAVAVAGISAGTAMISFDLSPGRPETDSSQQWEEATEFDYISTAGVAHLAVGMGPDEETDVMDAYEINLTAKAQAATACASTPEAGGSTPTASKTKANPSPSTTGCRSGRQRAERRLPHRKR